MNTIDKEEILKGSKWVRFLFMVVYAFAVNFVISISIGLAFVQFLFYLLPLSLIPQSQTLMIIY